MKITKISIKRSTLVVVVFSVLVLLGVQSYFSLNYELLPKFSPPVLTISTLYPGASPDEVENSVTKEIEDALSSLERVENMRSTSMESYSIIVVELEQGTDVNLSLQDAQRKIDVILGNLPEDADPPTLVKLDLDDLPVIQLGATADLPATAFFDLVEDKIKPSLSNIPGVARITVLGGTEREIKVNIDAEKLEVYGLSILQVQQAIQAANMDFPTGKIKDEEGQTLIRLAGKINSVDQLSQLVIAQYNDGGLVRLTDVAEVQDAEKDVEVLSRVDLNSAIGLSVQKQSDANAVEVSELVREALTDLKENYKQQNLDFVIANDTSEFTLEAANAVVHDLLLAVVLVAVVMLLFLHSFRNAVIVMIAIPASLISTLIAMSLLDYSLNIMSLLGLSLVVGILVDDAIVVIENIHRHMEMGKKAAQAAYDGIKEIGITVISITLVIMSVFVPIALTTGLVSDILRQFSVVVAVSTGLSLFVAFTLIPLLASRFSRLEHLNPKKPIGKFIIGFEKILDRIIDQLTAVLKWSFNHKLIVLGMTTLLFVSAIALIPAGFIGSEFISTGDRGEFIVKLELPKNATVEQTNFAARQVEQYLQRLPEVTSIFTTVGTTSSAQEGQTTAYIAELKVKLVDAEERNLSSEFFAQKVKIDLQSQLPGIKFAALPVSIVGGGNQAPIQMVLSGPNLDTLLSFANRVIPQVEKVQGTAEVESSVEEGNPEIKVSVDRDKMSKLGVSLQTVGGGLQTAFNGNTDSKFRSSGQDYDINIKLDKFDRRNKTDIGKLTFPNNQGQLIKLNQFADIVEGSGPSQLERQRRVPSVTVNAQVIGRPVGTVGEEIQANMANIEIPAGVSVAYEGSLKNQSEAFGTLGFALIAAIIFVYLIMVALYNSYVYPIVVLISIPLAIIGAIWALALTAQTLSIFSLLGIIMLIGLVAKNAILVVDFTNNLKAEGLVVKEALIEATRIRFRPILMTTLAMIFGMLPIALASGPGAEWKNGLAWALIGGLSSSLFLTLVVIPVIYYIFDRILQRFGWDKPKKIELVDKSLDELEHETAVVDQHKELVKA